MSEIASLARRIARSDPEDAEEQNEILDALDALRARASGPGAEEAISSLDSASLLTQYLTRSGAEGGEDVLRIVSRLVGSLNEEFLVGADEVAEAAPEAEVEGLEGSSGDQEPLAVFPSTQPVGELAHLDEPRVQSRRAPLSESLPDEVRSAQARLDRRRAQGEPPAGGARRVGRINDMLLGEILVQLGSVNSEQVREAVEHQRLSGLRFGEALVALGHANRSDVEAALAHQKRLHREAAGQVDEPEAPAAALPTLRPVSDDLRLVTEMMLGEVLLNMGRITQSQLEEGLQLQRAAGLRIGEALVQTGAVDQQTIRVALRAQSSGGAAKR